MSSHATPLVESTKEHGVSRPPASSKREAKSKLSQSFAVSPVQLFNINNSINIAQDRRQGEDATMSAENEDTGGAGDIGTVEDEVIDVDGDAGFGVPTNRQRTVKRTYVQQSKSPKRSKSRREATGFAKRVPQDEYRQETELPGPKTISNFATQAATPTKKSAQIKKTDKITAIPPQLLFQFNDRKGGLQKVTKQANETRADHLQQNDKYFSYEGGTNNDGFVYEGYGAIFAEDVRAGKIVHDFRSYPREMIVNAVYRMLTYMVLRPKKFCVRAKQGGFNRDAHARCMCLYNHKRALLSAIPELAGKTSEAEVLETIKNAPSIIVDIYERFARLITGFRFMGHCKPDDVYYYLLEHFIVTYPPDFNKGFYRISAPFQSEKKALEMLNGQHLCKAAISEFTGNRTLSNIIKRSTPSSRKPGPRLQVPRLIDGSTKRQRDLAFRWCCGPFIAALETILNGEAPNYSKYLRENNYDGRDVEGRMRLIAPVGKTLGALRQNHIRLNRTDVSSRQLVFLCFVTCMEMYGLSEMYEQPWIQHIWEMFVRLFGTTISKKSFETRTNEIIGAIVAQVPETESDCSIAFRVGSYRLAYRYPKSTLSKEEYKSCRVFIRRVWADSDKKWSRHPTFTTEPWEDKLEEGRNGDDYPGIDYENYVKDDDELLAIEQQSRTPHQSRIISDILFCKDASSSDAFNHRKEDVLCRNGLFEKPNFPDPITQSEKPTSMSDAATCSTYRQGLKGILYALNRKTCWKNHNLHLKHDKDCRVVAVPTILLKCLPEIRRGIAQKYGCSPLSALGAGMERLNGSDNLFIDRQGLSLHDLCQQFCENDQPSSENMASLMQTICEACQTNKVFSKCDVTAYVHASLVDYTKNAMECMRLEYSSDYVATVQNTKDYDVVSLFVPLAQEGATRWYGPHPFNEEQWYGPHPNEETMKASLEEMALAYTGSTCHVMYESMVVQPLSLLHADGLNLTGRANYFLVLTVVLHNGDSPTVPPRAQPNAYFGRTGPVNPTDEQVSRLLHLSKIQKSSTNVENPKQDLFSVVYFTPSKAHAALCAAAKSSQLETAQVVPQQGGSYLRGKFCPTLVYGKAENVSGTPINPNRGEVNDGKITNFIREFHPIPENLNFEDSHYGKAMMTKAPPRDAAKALSNEVAASVTEKHIDAPKDRQGKENFSSVVMNEDELGLN